MARSNRERVRTVGGDMTFALLSIMLFLVITVVTASAYGKEAPPLPMPTGGVAWVKESGQLKRAIEGAGTNSTIMIADGIYEPGELIYMRKGKNVTIRGASGDPSKCIIRGKGFNVGTTNDDILRLGNVENVTIANLSFEECRSYGIKIEGENDPRNVNIYNCHFHNIGVRAIKGTAGGKGIVAGGSVKYCLFENTKIPPADWLFGGNYITAIDMMVLDGWVFSDNTFKDIKGRDGQARGAIFIWVRSKNVTVERNTILNCDRGVSFGNPSGSTAFQAGTPHMKDAIIRNNFIVPGPDAGIELWWADNIKVYNNTIWRQDEGGLGIRGGSKEWPITNIDIANNLIRGTNMLTAEGVKLRNNLVSGLNNYFADAVNADLHITGNAAGAIDKAIPLAEVTDDYDGYPRGLAPDMGACEFGAREMALAAKAVSETAKEKPKEAAPLDPKKAIGAEREAMNIAAAQLAGGDTEGAKAAYTAIAGRLPEGPARDAVKILTDACSLREELVAMIVKNAAAAGPKKVYIDFAGSVLQGELSEADAISVLIKTASGPVPVEWAVVSSKRLGDIARKYAVSPAEKMTTVRFIAANGDWAGAKETAGEIRAAGPDTEQTKILDGLELLAP